MTKPMVVAWWDGEACITRHVGRPAAHNWHQRIDLIRLSDYDALASENARLRTALAATDKLASEAAQRDEELHKLLRETTAVAITMLYGSHKEDVLKEFTINELENVVAASEHLQPEQVEAVYHRAWNALSQQAKP